MAYITIAERISAKHRSKIIIHNGNLYFAEFDTIEQLEKFAKTLGFSYSFREEWQYPDGAISFYDMDKDISAPDFGGFWKLSELPDGARPIKALSNGSIVTCYFTNDGKTITMYRPNPNALEVYKPLSLSEGIAHRTLYGTY